MQYDYTSKNTGKDFILYNRLKIAEKLKIKPKSTKMYTYLMDAELSILLN